MGGYETAEQQFGSFAALSRRLDEETVLLEEKREAMLEQAILSSEAKRDAQIFKANIFLTEIGTRDEREYEAKKGAADKEHESRCAEAIADAARSAYFDQRHRIDNIRSKFQALQTVASTSRSQMELCR